MTIKEASAGVPVYGPNGATGEVLTLNKLDNIASLIQQEPGFFSNLPDKEALLSNLYDQMDKAGELLDEAVVQGGKVIDYGKEAAIELGERAEKTYQELSEEAAELADATKQKYEQTKELGGEIVDEYSEKANQTLKDLDHWRKETFGNKGIEFGNLSDGASQDSKIATPNCECQSMEPCCVISGEIKDADRDKVAGERKIEWPLCPGQPSNLLLIMKDVKGSHLGADIEVTVAGRNNSNCTNKYNYHPSVLETSGLGGEEYLVESKSERTVYFDKPDIGLLLSSTLFPAEVLGCFIVLKKVVEYVHGDHLKNGYAYKVVQCAQDETMGRTLQVIPLPYIKLVGNLTIQIPMTLTTEGVTISPPNEWFSGSLEAQYGDVEFSSTVTKKARSQGDEKKLPFPLFVVEKVKQIFDFLSSKSGVSGETLNKIKQAGADIAEGTGVTVTPKVEFTAEGVETKKVMGSPNVKLDLAALKVTLGGEIKGQIDILEIAVTLLSGGAAKVLKKAKEKAERIGDGLNSSLGGENTKLNSELVAMLEFGGSLDFITDYGSAGEVILQWDGKKVINGSAYEKEFKQEIKFFASAKISFVVEAEVIMLEAEAGINGVLNTAWNFQFKQKEEDGVVNEYKRYFFEGLKLKGGVYFGVKVSGSDATSEDDEVFNESESSVDQTVIEKEIDLLEPTVKEVTDDIPIWIKTS
jgi:hypothetical protein